MPDRRPDWAVIRSGLNLVTVATALLGEPQTRRGDKATKRHWWSCPFHHDPNPSFCVKDGGTSWKCYGCGEHGDAATLAMKILNVPFPEAVRHLSGDRAISATRRPTPTRKPTRPVAPEDNLPREVAERLVDEAVARLWSPEGDSTRAYLVDHRGLDEKTVLVAQLGLVARGLDVKGRPRGLVIPWYVGGELALVKLRQPKGLRPKYRQVFIDPALHVGIYPDPEAVRPGRPLIVTEGEFDGLLLAQELDDFDVGVITLGSASMRPTPGIRSHLLPASPWIIAADADEAGEKFAAAWPATARRVRPPEPDKDWTEVHAGGWGRLRYWWSGWLGLGAEIPVGFEESCDHEDESILAESEVGHV